MHKCIIAPKINHIRWLRVPVDKKYTLGENSCVPLEHEQTSAKWLGKNEINFSGRQTSSYQYSYNVVHVVAIVRAFHATLCYVWKKL